MPTSGANPFTGPAPGLASSVEILVVSPDNRQIAGPSTQFVSHELAAFGVHVGNIAAVDLQNHTPVQTVMAALRAALSHCDMVVLLGLPHESVATGMCEAVCRCLETPPERDSDSWLRAQEYARNTGSDATGQEPLALVPTGAVVFPNEHGSAPGFAVLGPEGPYAGKQILSLPGAPRELLPMFSDYVAPFLSNLTGGTVVSRTVGIFGLSETALVERLADLLSGANPGITIYPKDGEAVVRITARAGDRAAARALCDPVVAEIEKRVGINVYGVDVGSLQKAVVVLLLDKRLKIATAESCTAGMLSGRLTQIAGVSSVFECGVTAYSPGAKQDVLGVPADVLEQYGAVSPKTASAMAVGVRKLGNASLGVAITGVAGPDPSEDKPVGTVFIALADEKRVWVKKMSVPDRPADREYIRSLATVYALDLIRRYLEAIPTVMAGGEMLPPEAPPPPPVQIPQAEVETPPKRRLWQRIFPWKGDSTAVKLLKSGIMAAFLFLVTTSLLLMYFDIWIPSRNRELYDALLNNYNNTSFVRDPDVNYPDGLLKRFDSLYTLNSDVAGWLDIEGTGINYPYMSVNPSCDYSSHNFYKSPSSYGVPYLLSGRVDSADSLYRSYVITGNNTLDGQMFSDLVRYDSLDFLKEHPVIRSDTLFKGDIYWEVFSVFLATDPSSGGEFDYAEYGIKVLDINRPDTNFMSFAADLRSRSLFEIDTEITHKDTLLLLVTPYNGSGLSYERFSNGQIVIAARRVSDGATPKTDLSDARLNPDAVMPDAYPRQTASSTTASRRASTTSPAADASSSSSASSEETPSDDTSSSSGKDTTAPSGSSPVSASGSPSVSSPSGTQAAGTSSSASPPGTTTTESTSATETTPTTPDPSDGVNLYVGTTLESVYLNYFKFTDSDGATCTASNKQELISQLARIVKAECGSSAMMGNDLAAQKAQAIAAYTFILYSNMKEDRAPSCPTKSLSASNDTDNRILAAVEEVAGIKLLAGDKYTPLYTCYFAGSPGRTAANVSVYGNSLAHLQSVVSRYDEAIMPSSSSPWRSTFTISMADLKTKVEANLAEYFAPYKNTSTKTLYFESVAGKTPFYVRSYDPETGLYAMDTNIYFMSGSTKVYVPARMMRLALGSTNLRSFAFTVTSSTADSLTLDVKGYGHGVGMSQWGAAGYAQKEGWSYLEILAHYYSITKSSSHQLYAAGKW